MISSDLLEYINIQDSFVNSLLNKLHNANNVQQVSYLEPSYSAQPEVMPQFGEAEPSFHPNEGIDIPYESSAFPSVVPEE